METRGWQRPRWLAAVMVVGVAVVSGLAVNPAVGQQATFDGEKLVLPQVLFPNGELLSLELSLVNSMDEYWVYPFTPKHVMLMFNWRYPRNPVLGLPIQNPAKWTGDDLLVPRVDVGGTYFWVRFRFVDPWTGFGSLFKVVDYGEDDLDDDNDGIPDEIDPDPWLASSESDPQGIVGNWLLRRELFGGWFWGSDLEGTPCADFPRISFFDIEISYDADEGVYLIGSGGAFLKQIDPSPSRIISLKTTLPGSGGTLETTLELDVNSAQLITGTERWSWLSESGSCVEKTGVIHAVRK